MREKLALLVCFSLIIAVLAGGCQGSANKPLTPEKKPMETENTDISSSERRVMASKLSNIAEEVEGVSRATVVVSSIGMSQSNDTNNANKQTNNQNNNNTVSDDNQVDQRENNGNMNQAGQKDYNGMIVMIGLTVEDPNREKQIKEEVMNKVKASDQRISQVLVTTDPNLIKRINDVAAGIIEGQPIKSLDDDVNELNQRLKQEQPAY